MTLLEARRPTVYARDGFECAARTVAAFDRHGHAELTLQHRVNRGMGGAGETLDTFENLMALCATCNGLIEQDAGLADLARHWGWKLRSDENPLEVAVWFAGPREWRVLRYDGTYERCRGRNDLRIPFGTLEDWR